MKLVFHLHGITRRYNKRGRRASEYILYIITDDTHFTNYLTSKHYDSVMRMTIYSKILKKL